MKSYIIAFLLIPVLVILPGCKGKNDSKTVSNLKNAIIGETTASEKYAAYAKKAKADGQNKIAALFSAASKAENIHAKNHIAVLEKMNVKMDKFTPKFDVKTTKENIEDAIKGEAYEVQTMYPDFMKIAEKEKISDANNTYNYAFLTEKVHLELYKGALDALNKKDNKSLADKYLVCPQCGNTFGKNVVDVCNICGETKDKYIKM